MVPGIMTVVDPILDLFDDTSGNVSYNLKSKWFTGRNGVFQLAIHLGPNFEAYALNNTQNFAFTTGDLNPGTVIRYIKNEGAIRGHGGNGSVGWPDIMSGPAGGGTSSLNDQAAGGGGGAGKEEGYGGPATFPIAGFPWNTRDPGYGSDGTLTTGGAPGPTAGVDPGPIDKVTRGPATHGGPALELRCEVERIENTGIIWGGGGGGNGGDQIGGGAMSQAGWGGDPGKRGGVGGGGAGNEAGDADAGAAVTIRVGASLGGWISGGSTPELEGEIVDEN